MDRAEWLEPLDKAGYGITIEYLAGTCYVRIYEPVYAGEEAEAVVDTLAKGFGKGNSLPEAVREAMLDAGLTP